MKTIKSTTNIEFSPERKIKSKVEKKAGKRIGFNYIILKSLKESSKNDVVKCLYIKSLTDFGVCVIKEGTQGDTKDNYGRDIKDRLVWQQQLHAQLQNKIRIPRLLGCFEENENYYLVLECIKGKSLYKAWKEKNGELKESLIKGTKTACVFINYLLQIVEILNNLHQQQVVHRDATVNNFIITPRGKVVLIDMELCYSLQQQAPEPPYQLGTYGYMSPQQLKTEIPTIEEDIYSVGAIMWLLFTGISPLKITDIPKELNNKAHFFVTDKAVAEIITQCLHPEPTQRPRLLYIYNELEKYNKDLQLNKKRQLTKQNKYTVDQINEAIQQTIGTLCSPLLADSEKGWFSKESRINTQRDKNKITKVWYTGFYKGASGVLYFINQAHRIGFNTTAAIPHIQNTLSMIQTKYLDRIEMVAPGLHFGSSGIAVTLADCIRNELITPKPYYNDWIRSLLSVHNPLLNYTQGISGQGIAHLLCNDFMSANATRQQLDKYVISILEHQQNDGSWINKKAKNKTEKHPGFAIGTAGIIYFLLEYAQRYQNKEAQSSAEAGLRWLMNRTTYQKDTRIWKGNNNNGLMQGWLEGPAGISIAFMKGYSYLNNPIYKSYATTILSSHHRQIVDNNLSQLKGLSGLGEVYLQAYNIFNEIEWFERAGWIAQVLMHLKKNDSHHGPYWLVQNERECTSDFMTGTSGIMHFLLRYCYSDQIKFPMLT